MNRKISKIITSSIAVAALSSMAILATANTNYQINRQSNEIASNAYSTSQSNRSVEEDVYDVVETKSNIIQYKDKDGKHVVKGESTYEFIEIAFLESVVTIDGGYLDNTTTDIIFYERVTTGSEEELVRVDDKTVTWETDEIIFRTFDVINNIESDVFSIDMKYNVSIEDLFISDVAQSKIQIDYDVTVSDENPIQSINLVDFDGNIIYTETPVYDETQQTYESHLLVDGLDNNNKYAGCYIQIEYGVDTMLSETIITGDDLENSSLEEFKTLTNLLAIKDNKVIAQPNIDGDLVTIGGGHSDITIEYGVYDDGASMPYDKNNTKASIVVTDEFGVSTEEELGITVFDDINDPETLVQEHGAVLSTQYREDVTYSDLKISLTGSMADAIRVSIYDETGNIVLPAGVTEVPEEPSNLVLIIVVSSLITAMVIIMIVGGVVIWKKHHFHH